MDSIAVRGQRTGVRSGLPKQGRYDANSFVAGERFSMSKASCGSRRPVKVSNQSRCGRKGASQQIASAEPYATPSTKELGQAIKEDDIVLAYVVRTCQPIYDGSRPSPLRRHTGSEPNLDGGRITLCTCKHKMRTSPVFVADGSKSRIWIAGFSSSKGGEENWLFCLMKVDEAFDDQCGIYERLGSATFLL